MSGLGVCPAQLKLSSNAVSRESTEAKKRMNVTAPTLPGFKTLAQKKQSKEELEAKIREIERDKSMGRVANDEKIYPDLGNHFKSTEVSEGVVASDGKVR